MKEDIDQVQIYIGDEDAIVLKLSNIKLFFEIFSLESNVSKKLDFSWTSSLEITELSIKIGFLKQDAGP